MSVISIQTKKVSELAKIITPSDEYIIPIHDGTGLKTITFKNFSEKVTEPVNDKIAPLLFNNAGAHNSIYRGKFLGTSVTTAQYNAISDGVFTDLYIGDYWTINSINYRIAAFDYYLNCGDNVCTDHHIVLVPDTILYNYVMNDSNSTTGAYIGSKMYKEGLEEAKTIIKSAFSGHVLSHRAYFTNATSNGKSSANAWCDSEVDLMCEHMVYGSGIFNPVSDGSTVPNNHRIEKSQLPLFQHEPSRIANQSTWWLRDVITSTQFSRISNVGYVLPSNATGSLGVRPSFAIS